MVDAQRTKACRPEVTDVARLAERKSRKSSATYLSRIIPVVAGAGLPTPSNCTRKGRNRCNPFTKPPALATTFTRYSCVASGCPSTGRGERYRDAAPLKSRRRRRRNDRRRMSCHFHKASSPHPLSLSRRPLAGGHGWESSRLSSPLHRSKGTFVAETLVRQVEAMSRNSHTNNSRATASSGVV